MEGRRLGVFGAAMCAVMAFCGMVWGDPSDARDTVTDKTIRVERGEVQDELIPPPSGVVPVDMEIHTVTSGGPLRVIRVYPDGTQVTEGVTAAGPNPAERQVYSNTMGFQAIAPGANVRVADDIVITAADGCQMTRFAFDVAGNLNGATGSYTVTYALMNTCPGAIDPSIINNRTIPQTSGSVLVPSEEPTRIEVVIPDANGTAVPTNLWLSLIFSRSNAGPIVGAPAQEGFSMDLYHQAGSTACSVNFGNFPGALHGSFNAQVWAGTLSEACPAANIAYHGHRETGPLYNPGTNCWLTDDIGLLPQSCNLVGYEVTVKGAGTYNFEFRNGCDGLPIPGTAKTQIVAAGSLNSTERRNVRFIVDPPVNISPVVRFAARVNNSTGAVVSTGQSPPIGRNLDQFEILCPPATSCNVADALSGQHDAVNLTILCQNAAPPGACCDMFVPECEGGARDGMGCRSNADCPSPGTCEVSCRELAEANCTFPPPGTTQEPGFEPGDSCDPNPFPDTVCGQAACCHLNEEELDICLNLTQNECFAQEPVEAARQWQRGRLCGIIGQTCPINACLGREGSCSTVHPEPGCQDPTCCTAVCNVDDFCCLVEWDPFCVETANDHPACSGAPPNDQCVGAISPTGFPETMQSNNSQADIADSADPNLCCHDGLPLTCLGGDFDGLGVTCATDEECTGGGTCGTRPPEALFSVWYKWVQPVGQTTMRVETCPSNSPANDGIIQAFSVGDNSSPQSACETLTPIGCADNGCGASGNQGRICLTGLVPGRTYYAMVGAKTFEARGDYRVNFTPGCTAPSGTLGNDWCPGGTVIGDGATAFNLTNATLDCPTTACLPTNTRDVWFNYIATCTGNATFQTCTGSPDTGIAVYERCDTCPTQTTEPLACNEQSPFLCGGGSGSAAVSNVHVAFGDCYKVRVANNGNNTPTGQLTVSCSSTCDPGTVTFHEPPNGVVDGGRPHSPFAFDPPLGIQEIHAQGPVGVGLMGCWRVDCETVRPGGEENDVESVTETSPGSGIWKIRLLKPINPNAFTSVRYLGNPVNDPASVIRFTANAANVNGDFAVDTGDINAWVSAMDVEFPGPPPAWGQYGLDADRSGMASPQDLLDIIDMMNGAEQYEPQLNTLRPSPTPCLP